MRIFACWCLCLLAPMGSAIGQVAHLTRNISDGPARFGGDIDQQLLLGFDYQYARLVGDRRLALLGAELPSGFGVWATDGSPGGAELIARGIPSIVGSVGSHMIFAVTSRGSRGDSAEWWRTDGTRSGTRKLHLPIDLLPWYAKSARAGDLLYFAGRLGEDQQLLVASDATLAGTTLLRTGSWIREIQAVGDKAVVLASAGDRRPHELWVSDGSMPGTRVVHTLRSPPPLHLDVQRKSLFGFGDDVLFFDGLSQRLQLWLLTAEGELTQLTAFDRPALDYDYIHNRLVQTDAVVRGESIAFFTAFDVSGAPQIWSTQGTPESTRRQVENASTSQAFVVGDRLIYSERSGLTTSVFGLDVSAGGVQELGRGEPRDQFRLMAGDADRVFWSFERSDEIGRNTGLVDIFASDGTPGGTFQVAQCREFRDCTMRAAAGGSLYFDRQLTQFDFELWRLDEDATQPRLLREFSRNPRFRGDFALVENGVVFTADVLKREGDRINDSSVVLVDGGESTELVHDLFTWDGSAGGTVAMLNDQALFLTASGLWKSGGEESSTELTSLLAATTCTWMHPQTVTSQSDATRRLLLECVDGVYATDGSAPATRVMDLAGRVLRRLVFRDGVALFAAGNALYRTDGTATGSRVVADVGERIKDLTLVGDLLYFLGTSREGAWRSDGTSEGTWPLGVDIGFGLHGFAGTKNYAFFYEESVISFLRSNFWRTDGTVNGTVDIAALNEDLPLPRGALQGIGDRLVYFNRDGLWALHETDLSFERLSDDFSEDRFRGQAFFPFESWLYFTSTGPLGRSLLWRTDGTPSGTELVLSSRGETLENPSRFVVHDGILYFSASTPEVGEELWWSDGTTQGTRLVQDVNPGPLSSSPGRVVATSEALFFAANDGLHGHELWSASLLDERCTPSPRRLCLLDRRFQVDMGYRVADGGRGRGTAESLSTDSGYFWFFDADNVETVAKMVDGRDVNDNFWTFFASLSDVEFDLTVTDSQSGRAVRYTNPRGRLASVGDTAAFGELSSSAWKELPESTRDRVVASLEGGPPGSCSPSPMRLCLGGGRFAVEATWTDFAGGSGVGNATELTGDTGTFWFFDPRNVELVVKVLDGRGVNGRYWVFFGGLSNVAYSIVVTDTETGSQRVYGNPLGEFGSGADTDAF